MTPTPLTAQKEQERMFYERLADRKWRLNNLYYIKNSSGKKIRFKMNPVQEFLHDNLWYRNVIPKARKLGVSTFFSILNLDQILFSTNKTAGIIAHREADMKKLFRNNILFAVNNLDPWVASYIGKTNTSTANEISFNNGGMIFVSLTTRGDTPQFLHISEMGYIDAHSPEKSDEIVSGAINSVAIGSGNIVSIESTADNGRAGNFFDITMTAEKNRIEGTQLTELDWKIFFFPWHLDPQYQLHNADFLKIPGDMQEYFLKLEREEKVRLSPEQQRWYVKAKETNRDKMFSQFPSTLAEAFSISLEGAYYAKEVNAVYGENRLGFFPVDPAYPVDTAWDLGMNDSTAIVFFQSIGAEIRFVDFYESSGVGLAHYAGVLRERGYRYGKHILPHDIQVRDLSTGVSRLNMLWELGVQNTMVAPKIFISDGIEKVRLLFSRFRFDKGKAGKILDGLQTYRKQFDAKKGVWQDTPFHGPESHVADAVRTMAVIWSEQFSSSLVDEWGDPVESDIRITSFFT
jgi:hypothetical protein